MAKFVRTEDMERAMVMVEYFIEHIKVQFVMRMGKLLDE